MNFGVIISPKKVSCVSQKERKVISKTQPTCGIMLRFPCRSWSPIVDISIPSIIILLSDLSRTLNKQFVSVDLPAPVLPTIPTWNSFLIKAINFHATHAIWNMISEFSVNFQFKTSVSFSNMQSYRWIKLKLTFGTRDSQSQLSHRSCTAYAWFSGNPFHSPPFCLAVLSSNQWL